MRGEPTLGDRCAFVNSVGPGIKVGLTALVIAALAFFAFKFISKGIGREKGYPVWALFRDAGGLVDKSRVQVAGLTIGEIRERTLQGNFARVSVVVKPDADLWSNATIYKKTASLLGEYYLDIDPGTPESPDPLTRKMVPNYRLKDCQAVTHNENCNQITNVVEAVTAGEILRQMSETLPVLRDILKDVQKITQGPLQQIAADVQAGVAKNSEAAERLLNHIDEIAGDVHQVTGGEASENLQKSMANIREITDQVKKLVGTGEGQVNSTADKLKDNLDKLTITLDKFNASLDNVQEVTSYVAKGHGTVGRLLKDEAIADNVTDITEDVSGFIRSLTRLQTIVGIREEFHVGMVGGDTSYKTYFSLRLQPRPDKYYLIELVDDPRGSYDYGHTFTATGNDPKNPTVTNTDTWTRGHALRVSFMLAKQLQIARAVMLTGRLGVKESTGGVGGDLDVGLRDGLWLRSLSINVDLFNFTAERYPRLKIMVALELFKYVWLTAGLDDLLNRSGVDGPLPAGVTCGPATPLSWCASGREFFAGLGLTFNDDDLRTLLAVGAGALAGAATSGK